MAYRENSVGSHQAAVHNFDHIEDNNFGMAVVGKGDAEGSREMVDSELELEVTTDSDEKHSDREVSSAQVLAR